MSSSLDPLLADSRAREPTPEEERKLFDALGFLLAMAQERRYQEPIEVPDKWRIADKYAHGYGYALGAYGVVYTSALDSAYLPAALAHIIGWYNHPDQPKKEQQPAYQIALARDQAASFTYQLLPSHLDERFLNNRSMFEDTFRRDKLTTSSLPESLRPKPVDVLVGGGHNYLQFGYKREEEVTVYTYESSTIAPATHDSDSAEGIVAVMQYMEALKYVRLKDLEQQRKIEVMRDYFARRRKYAEYFKKAQLYADFYASYVFGQASQLLALLTPYKHLSGADSDQTLHFYQPIPVRISYLTKIVDVIG